MALFGDPAGSQALQVGSGLVLPFAAADDGWLEVTTTCGTTAWLRAAEVEVVGAREAATPGPDFDLGEAVIVLDPGHGGPFPGAKGPSGLSEKVPNLDVANRVRSLLTAGQTVDWRTGEITVGDDYPPVAEVLMTRDPSAVAGGDHEATLSYRAAVGTTSGADAMVSIHANTVPKGTRTSPGTQVFFSVGAEGSDRLGSLLHEEVKAALAVFDIPWTGLADAGPRGYTDDDGADYFTVLAGDVPAAIVEGLYLSEPAEEDLLQRPEGRQAYAEGIYKGLIRFLTTDEWGTDSLGTAPWPGASPGSPTGGDCEVPSEG